MSSEETILPPEPVSAPAHQSSASSSVPTAQQHQQEAPSTSRTIAAAAPPAPPPVPTSASTMGDVPPPFASSAPQYPAVAAAAAAAPVEHYPGQDGRSYHQHQGTPAAGPPVTAPPPPPPAHDKRNYYDPPRAQRTAAAAAANANYHPPAPPPPNSGASLAAVAAAPPQQPYHSPPPYYHHHPHPRQQEEQPPDATPLLAAAVTAGGVLGLAAAAAVRWLNGGDFALFPPAAIDGLRTEAEEEEAAATAGDSSRMQQRQQQEAVTASLRNLREAVAAQSEQQAVLLRRVQEVLEAREQRQSTDGSMNLLLLKQQQQQQQQQQAKAPSADSATSVLEESLRHIHSELTALRRQERTADENENSRLGATLDRLNDVLEQIAISDQKAATAAAASTAKNNENDDAASEKTPSKVSFLLETPCNKPPPPPPLAPDDERRHHHQHQPLADAIFQLLDNNGASAVRAGAQLLYLYCVNVSSHPRVPRYRKIYTTNESFRSSVAPLQGAPELLRAVGFVPVGNGNGGSSGHAHPNSSATGNTGPTAVAEAAAYWEWLPPSIRNNQKTNDADTNNDTTVEPSPKQAWLGDSEEFYLHRLKVAAAALSLIKSPSFGSSTSSKRELFELLGLDSVEESADKPNNAAPAFSIDELSVTTPDRSGISFSDDGGNDSSNNPVNCTPTINGQRRGHHPASCFETPDTGSVLSPPATKKQSSLSSDFPSLDHPLGGDRASFLSPPSLNVLDEGDSYEPTSEENSFVGTGDGNQQQSETAMWK